MLDRLEFLVSEAFVALRRNWLMTFAAITTAAVALSRGAPPGSPRGTTAATGDSGERLIRTGRHVAPAESHHALPLHHL